MVTFPNAKINIGLYVIGKRSDGFHDLETVFFPVGWSDALEIANTDDDDFQFSTSGLEIPGSAETNLAIKAYSLLRDDFKLPPLKIHLHKNIPFGAGLGGGSSDGAFMLRLINHSFGLGLDTDELRRYAALLGSDCPFFILNKPVFATGRGEIMNTIDLSLQGLTLVLAKPPVEVSTAAAFRNIHPRKPDVSLSELIKLPVEQWKHHIINQFEDSVFQSWPEIAAIKALMYEKGAVYASMSGSGSSVFGLFDGMPKDITSCFPDTYLTFTQKF